MWLRKFLISVVKSSYKKFFQIIWTLHFLVGLPIFIDPFCRVGWRTVVPHRTQTPTRWCMRCSRRAASNRSSTSWHSWPSCENRMRTFLHSLYCMRTILITGREWTIDHWTESLTVNKTVIIRKTLFWKYLQQQEIDKVCFEFARVIDLDHLHERCTVASICTTFDVAHREPQST